MARVVRRRKKKKKIIKGVLILLIMFTCLGTGLFFAGKFIKNTFFDKKGNDNKTEEKVKEDPKPKDETYKLSMIMVGDMLVHGAVYQDAYDYTTKTYDFKKHVELIKPIVQKYDLAFYNQETILGGTEIGLSHYPRFNSPYEVGDAMIDAGFNMVSLSNNHTLDRGEEAILNSDAYWKKQKGILTAGSYTSLEDRNEIKIVEKNNIKYTLLAYTTTTNGLYAPYGKEYFVNVYDEETVKKDIEAVRDQVDVIFVSMHWGEEYTSTPVYSQKEIAKYLAGLGVDVIIGTHPHVVEPIEKIDNTLVFYSLGNFLSAQTEDMNYAKLVGLMPSLEISKHVTDDKTEISIANTDNELIFTYFQGISKYKVIPFSQMTTAYNYNYKSLYNTYSAVVKMYDETVPVAAIN